MTPSATQRHCLYECRVKHARLRPRRHAFLYRLFFLCLDLDAIPALARRIPWFGHNRFNLFSFYDRDHVEIPGVAGSLRAHLAAFLRGEGFDLSAEDHVQLVTFPRVLGYGFSPVSFYYVSNSEGEPLCSVAEVTNTYREIKLFYLPGPWAPGQKYWQARQTKNFYVSPYSTLDTAFDFRLGLPGERLQVNINDFEGDDLMLVSWIKGERRALSGTRLLWYGLKYPFLTLSVMARIHWQAFRLFLKRVPYHLKHSRPEAQVGLLRPHTSITRRK